jgi:hypothetical protein
MCPIQTTWAVLLAAALTTTPAWAEETSEETAPSEVKPRTGWGLQGMPLFGYDSDTGVSYGARVLLVDSGDGSQRPYRYSVMAQFYQTTRGVTRHLLTVDAPDFLRSPWRLKGQLSLLNDRFSPYYGLGGAATYTQSFDKCEDRNALETEPDVCPGNLDFRGLRYYSFEQRTFPSVILNASRSVSGPLRMALGYRIRFTRVSSRYGPEDLGQARESRFEEDARAGLLRGLDAQGTTGSFRTAEVMASLLLDTRDNEPAPVRGMFHELTARAAHTAIGSSFDYWGATAHLRFYHPVGDERLVAALRILVDVMGGDVPLSLLSSFGGVEWQGIGGVLSARGILKNRIQGEVKTLANGELRWLFLSVSPLRQQLDFTLAAFVDAGKGWADVSFRDPGLLLYAGGGGLRVAWEKNFIVRLDCGYSPLDGTTGVYLDFYHMF